jgi:hypothetical protein
VTYATDLPSGEKLGPVGSIGSRRATLQAFVPASQTMMLDCS